MEKFDTVIVGAGPAGLRCAKVLAENGKDVLVLERSPEPFRKICTGLWPLSGRTSIFALSPRVMERKFSGLLFQIKIIRNWLKKTSRFSQP